MLIESPRYSRMFSHAFPKRELDSKVGLAEDSYKESSND